MRIPFVLKFEDSSVNNTDVRSYLILNNMYPREENGRHSFLIASNKSTIFSPDFNSGTVGAFLEGYSSMEGSTRISEILVYRYTYFEYGRYFTYPLYILI